MLIELVTIITICLLTLSTILCIFLAAFLKLWREPPKLIVTVPELNANAYATFMVPDMVTIKNVQSIESPMRSKPIDDPIPAEILLYISQESDTFAQDARKRRARMLKQESGSWDIAFSLLQKEDNPNTE